MSQAGRTRYFARSVTRARSARRGEEKNKAPVIALDFCCIYIGLVFIKDSEIWVLRLRDRVLRFRDLGSSFSRFGVFVFEFWGLRFRVLGSSFSRFGVFVFEIWGLRSSVFVFECFVFETTDCSW